MSELISETTQDRLGLMFSLSIFILIIFERWRKKR